MNTLTSNTIMSNCSIDISSPLDIPDLKLWFDADDASTITLNGADVAQWNDKSIKGDNAVQATASKQPLYDLNSVNNRNALYMDGVNEYMAAVFGETYSQPNTIFIVASHENATAEYIIDGTNNLFRHSCFYASYLGTPAWDMFGGAELTNPFPKDADVHLHRLVFNSSNSQYAIDHSTVSEGDAGTQGCLGIYLGSRVIQTDTLKGHFCELLMYNRVLTPSETNQVENYLNAKWAIY